VRAGQWDRAEQIAQSISDKETQARVQGEIATVLADVGQWDRSEQITRAIAVSFDRAQALINIAERMATTSPHPDGSLDARSEQLRNILALVLVGENWSLALSALGDLMPEVLESIFAAVTRDGNA